MIETRVRRDQVSVEPAAIGCLIQGLNSVLSFFFTATPLSVT